MDHELRQAWFWPISFCNDLWLMPNCINRVAEFKVLRQLKCSGGCRDHLVLFCIWIICYFLCFFSLLFSCIVSHWHFFVYLVLRPIPVVFWEWNSEVDNSQLELSDNGTVLIIRKIQLLQNKFRCWASNSEGQSEDYFIQVVINGMW